MDERAALYQSIIDSPDDDTLRLVYADWLDENGDADRAEFIRGQLKYEQLRRTGYHCYHDITRPAHCEMCVCRVREKQLLDAHRSEWSRSPCPPSPFGCEGTGWAYGTPNNCRVCGGAGDLLRKPLDAAAPFARTLDFRRGFIDSVSCTIEEAMGAWGRALVKAHPVTRFVPANGADYFFPVSGDGPNGRVFAVRPMHPNEYHLPHAVYDALESDDTDADSGWWKRFPTREAAVDALALAIGRIARTSF